MEMNKSQNSTKTKSVVCSLWRIKSVVLTVVAVRSGVGGHGAVTCEVLPLLDAHAHIGAGVLLAGRTRTCVKVGDRRRHGRAALPSTIQSDFWALMTDSCRTNAPQRQEPQVGGNSANRRSLTWTEDFNSTLFIADLIHGHLFRSFCLFCRRDVR